MSVIVPPERIGLVGLGKMGAPMARNLARAGYALALHDLDRATAAALARELGAVACDDLASLAAQCRVVITMVPDGKVVREIALGEQGGAQSSLCGGWTGAGILIDMSSSAPIGTRSLGEALAARGIRMIDAPVSGGVRRAVTGKLAIMVGGDAAVLESCRRILEAIGEQIFHAGPLGAGHAIKCLNNYVSAAGLLAAAEGLVAAQRFGIDPRVALDVMNASTGKNNSTENKFAQFVFTRDFGSGFSLGLMAKDLRTALELGDAVGASMPLARHCVPLWSDAERSLGSNADHTEIARVIERDSGTELRGGDS